MSPSLPPAPQKPSETAISTEERRSNRQKRIQATLKWLGFPTGGIGLAGVGYFLKTGQFHWAILAGFASIGVLVIALAAKFFAELGNKVLDRIEERLEARTDPLADWIVASLEGGLVGLWWRLTPQFKGAYYQSLIYAYEAFEIKGLKTSPAVTPDLEKVFVPLRVQPNSLGKISSALIQFQESEGGLKIWDLLAESRKEGVYKRLVILGAPGSGKTTLLKHLTLTYARNLQRKEERRAPKLLPVLLLLHQVRERILSENPPPLPVLIADQVKRQPSGRKLNAVPRWFEERLQQGKCLVMLDGLDEVADEKQRKAVSAWVDQQMQDYPETNWILTSRPFGYEEAPLFQAVTMLEVLSFSLGQMEDFLWRWYRQNEIRRRVKQLNPGMKAEAELKASDLINRIKNSPPLAKMALNPLLLTMIATVHDNRGALPGSRVELYDEICDVLLVRRQAAKKVVDEFPLKADQKQVVLQALALALMEKKTRNFSLGEGVEIIQRSLTEVAGERIAPGDFIRHVQNVCALLVEQEVGSYQFAHLSFQEYLAATEIRETNAESKLCAYLQDSWWHETIRLYAAKSDTTRLIEAALVKPTVESLTIAYDCLDEGQRVNPATREKLEQQSLNSDDPKVAKLAAEVMLKRRLDRLTRIDDACAIDCDYITRAEYQLFLNEAEDAQDWTLPSNPRAPIVGLSVTEAVTFCHWLSRRSATSDELHFYRLPKQAELEKVPAVSSSSLEALQLSTARRRDPKQGLRLVKATVPKLYQPLLLKLLYVPYAGGAQALPEWKQADEATAQILRQLTNRPRNSFLDAQALKSLPAGALELLDQLWFYFSQGRFGFGMQACLMHGSVGSAQERLSHLSERLGLGWNSGEADAFGNYPRACYATADDSLDVVMTFLQRYRSCGIESLPVVSFEVVQLDARGREQRRETRQNIVLREFLAEDCSLEMLRIPAGQFLMGSSEQEEGHQSSESPQHEVAVPEFWMGRHAVTQQQWRMVAALPQVERELKPAPSRFEGDELPVEKVSWYDAVEFCARLNRHTGHTYRLPTEAEWEYACRAGTTTPFHFGETITPEHANYRGKDWKINKTPYPGNYAQGPKGRFREATTLVGEFGYANQLGLSDMHGNVWEWCQDQWHQSYEGPPGIGSAWIDQEESEDKAMRVLRGGSWVNTPAYCRSAGRLYNSPSDADGGVGFRVVCGVARL